jgi:hypothetical protein
MPACSLASGPLSGLNIYSTALRQVFWQALSGASSFFATTTIRGELSSKKPKKKLLDNAKHFVYLAYKG